MEQEFNVNSRIKIINDSSQLVYCPNCEKTYFEHELIIVTTFFSDELHCPTCGEFEDLIDL